MSGNVEGSRKSVQVILAKYGPDHYQKIGRKGGQGSSGYKFAHGKLDPSETGKLNYGRPKTKRITKEEL